jgi:hypothetical protein
LIDKRGETNRVVCKTRCQRNHRLDILLDRGPFQQGQEHQNIQGSRDQIDCDLQFIALGHLGLAKRHDTGIRKQHVQAIQLLDGAMTEGARALKGGQIQRPHFNGGGRIGDRGQDFLPDSFSPLRVPDGEDQASGTQAGEVARGFEAEAAGGAGDDDGLAVIGGGWRGDGGELAFEEGGDEGEAVGGY